MERITDIPALPPRPATGNKGTFGTVLVAGGSRGMAGAVVLAGRAALESGAGLVRIAIPNRILDSVAVMAPTCITVPLADTPQGQLSSRAAGQVLAEMAQATVLALGPGLGRSGEVTEVVRSVLESLDKPVVVDADALNAVATIGGFAALRKRPSKLVITPHPGEAARLLKTDVKTIQADREAAAVKLAAPGLVALLKGHQTVVTDGRWVYVNTSGNAGMATAGSGDVLTGLVAALLGQGLEPFEAAVLGAWLHGTAGDQAAAQKGMISTTAEDILRCLHRAFLIR